MKAAAGGRMGIREKDGSPFSRTAGGSFFRRFWLNDEKALLPEGRHPVERGRWKRTGVPAGEIVCYPLKIPGLWGFHMIAYGFRLLPGREPDGGSQTEKAGKRIMSAEADSRAG